MNEPAINEGKFQEWLQAHLDILMSGNSKIVDVRMLYGDAFADGWYAALQYAENLNKNLWHL